MKDGKVRSDDPAGMPGPVDSEEIPLASASFFISRLSDRIPGQDCSHSGHEL